VPDGKSVVATLIVILDPSLTDALLPTFAAGFREVSLIVITEEVANTVDPCATFILKDSLPSVVASFDSVLVIEPDPLVTENVPDKELSLKSAATTVPEFTVVVNANDPV
jgi:hypothetical protein